jgi:hypothetical protein
MLLIEFSFVQILNVRFSGKVKRISILFTAVRALKKLGCLLKADFGEQERIKKK